MGELGEMLREPGASIRQVFRNPGLRRLNLAFAGSNSGDWAFAVAISIFAYEHGGPTVLGVVGVVRYIAMASLGPFMSSLGDRYSRKWVMVSADLVRGALVATAAVVVAIAGPAVFVYVLATVSAVAGTAFRPAQAALLPALARDPAELTAANATSSTIESVGFFAGPALAALLLAVSNLPTVFAFNAISFLWSASFIFRIHVDAQPRAAKQEESGLIVEALQGFRVISSDRDTFACS